MRSLWPLHNHILLLYSHFQHSNNYANIRTHKHTPTPAHTHTQNRLVNVTTVDDSFVHVRVQRMEEQRERHESLPLQPFWGEPPHLLVHRSTFQPLISFFPFRILAQEPGQEEKVPIQSSIIRPHRLQHRQPPPQT